MISMIWRDAIIIYNNINDLQVRLKIRHIHKNTRNKQKNRHPAKLHTGLSTDTVEMFSLATQRIRLQPRQESLRGTK
ncbi:MAG: hypothetical protein COB39_12180 [Marinosulfonomonas sp.]|nr:MAG: hypothetical protein COB39_12180 [Marinosulfonomonas sp.]